MLSYCLIKRKWQNQHRRFPRLVKQRRAAMKKRRETQQ